MKKITLVLLPGLNGTDGLFQLLIELKPHDLAIIALNYPTDSLMSYSDLTDFVLKELKDVKGDYILVGESFSGPLSLFIAQTNPKALKGVILVATFITVPHFKIGMFLPWTLGFYLTKPLYKIRLLLSRNENKKFIQAISQELEKVSPIVLADRIKSIFHVDAKDALKACSVPIVYFQGQYDNVVPKKNYKLIQEIKSSSQLVSFSTKHFILQAQPKEAWIAIEKFIDKIKQ